ncbi:MAG TPA: hypothetical protein VFI70_10285 [Nitrososphaeraceae archaeon]|nr:hypothetical protein [Nitrososphaeraceae archaeon]
MMVNNRINSLMRSHPLSVSIAVLIIAVVGAFVQTEGASWDVTSHLLRRPETFFTPSHTMLYTGVGLLIIAAAISANLLLKNKEIRNKSFSTALKLLMIGSTLSIVAGPSDYLWHQIYGVDGLLSPTHLTLVTGMLINSIAIVLGLARIVVHLPTAKERRLIKALMIPAFAVMWITMIWYVYMFALPLSNGVHFNFNLNPVHETIIAIIALPIIGSIVFITASRTIGRFGAASAVTALLLGMNSFANIIPSNQLTPLLPWYLMLIIPAVFADFILNKSIIIRRSKRIKTERSVIISGAIIGSMFYMLGYPMLPMTFAEPLSYTFHSMNDIFVNFVRTLPLVLVFTAVPGVAMGIVGAIISTKKIKVPQANIPSNTLSEAKNKNYNSKT